MAEIVLGELRKVVRKPDSNDRPRLDELQRAVFGVLEPFLLDGDDVRPGQIKRSSIGPIWTWLSQTALPKEAEAFRDAFGSAKQEGRVSEMEQVLRRFQLAAADAIGELISPKSQGGDRQRSLGRVGSPTVVEDLPSVQTILANREAIETFRSHIPRIMSSFGDSQVELDQGPDHSVAVAADPPGIAIRHLHDHAADDVAMADHSARHKLRLVRRREPGGGDTLRACRQYGPL